MQAMILPGAGVEFGEERFAACPVAGDGDDARAAFRQLARRDAADAGGGSGNDDGSAVQSGFQACSSRLSAAARLWNRPSPSVPPVSGSTRFSGCGIRPSTRRFGE